MRRDPVERDTRLTALERAEEIVFLDASLWRRQGRILRRFILRKLGLEPSHKKDSLRGLLGLMAWDRRWDRVHRADMMTALGPYRDEWTVLVGTSNQEP